MQRQRYVQVGSLLSRRCLHPSQEQEQLRALQEKLKADREATGDLGVEGGYGGQEGLEDRYATTSGEH